MDDAEIVGRISELVEEEHRLEREHERGKELAPEERGRLSRLEAQLDQCWDLLRQRRARREFGQDPDRAAVRPSEVVENYRQ